MMASDIHDAELLLESYAQPIWSIPHGRIVGYEALIRVTASTGPVAPPHYFAADGDEALALRREEQARTLHLSAWARWHARNCWLFLNVSPAAARHALDHPSGLYALMLRYAVPAESVVVELLESSCSDLAAMQAVVQHYRELGCLVALDDFGVGHSNLDRLFVLAPDLVKIDRSLLVAATQEPSLHYALRHLVGLIHAAGALALIEGVESDLEAEIALDAGADLIQGFRYGRPAPWSSWSEATLLAHARTLHADRSQPVRTAVPETLYRWFAGLVQLWRAHGALGAWACTNAPQAVLRLYELDRHGVQIGDTLHCRWRQPKDTSRYAPLAQAEGACWAHRSYFRQALARPNQIIASEPYLALPARQWEITLAYAMLDKKAERILCADLDQALCIASPSRPQG